MRLLHAKTWQLSEFFDEIPPYAILSHTWGQGEVSFEDVKSGTDGYALLSEKAGFAKFRGCCLQALEDGLDYVWIDTCCIDKSSSAELSEAINSMFCWYQEAHVCYAYLSDVLGPDKLAFTSSRWHTRGWTLQELLAPKTVDFYDVNWARLGSKVDLCHFLRASTGISVDFLSGRPLEEASVAQRMSWAAKRKTLRKEDAAYCLLGIFGVNMPMVYGEGTRAFVRLQEEIIRDSRDLSLFAWGFNMPWTATNSIFAPSPREYLHCSDMEHVGWPENCGFSETHYFTTNRGLHIHLPVHVHRSTETAFVILDCGIRGTDKESDDMLLGLPLPSKNDEHTVLVRHKYSQPILVYKDTVEAAKFKDVIIEKHVPRDIATATMRLEFGQLVKSGYVLANVFPPHAIHEVDAQGSYVSLLPTDCTMLVFRQDHRSCCFYLHIQGWTTPEFSAVLSPVSMNTAYLYWRLASSSTLLDALEQEMLDYHDMLLFLDFARQVVAQESNLSLATIPGNGSFASDIIGAIRGAISASKTTSRDGNTTMKATRKRTTPGTMGAIYHEDNLPSWNIRFDSFNDPWMDQLNVVAGRLPIATLSVGNERSEIMFQLSSRPRKEVT